jgi:hypothetical protein
MKYPQCPARHSLAFGTQKRKFESQDSPVSSPEYCEFCCSETKQQSREIGSQRRIIVIEKFIQLFCLLIVFLTLEDNAISVSEVISRSNLSLLDLLDSPISLSEHSINTAIAIAIL